ncbi:MAG: uncharacterized protein KVP18_002882 [Porospora cf. gigantea A]|nr:MAG: hypothetical protein KVP18_002882 [Porospora cf. gigantea A]
MIGPSSETMLALGALNANFMRNRDESIRMFWSMYMHTGWYHIGMNVMAQLQYMYMYEPDWGFWRTFLVFWVGGISGNITSASVNPCGTTVGSSGGLFGLIGANIVYLFEYWQTVPRPLILVVFTLVIALVSILMGLSGSTDNWAHLGGFIGGFLFAGGTVTVLSVLETKQAHLRRKMRHTEGILQRKNERRMKPLWKKVITKIRDETFASYECGLTVWIFRGVCWGLLILGQILGFLGVFYVPWRASKYFGAMTWSGDSHCCCCDVLYNNTSIFGGILPNNFAVKEGIEVWYLCLGCDYTFTGETWEEACAGNYGYPPKSPAMSANLLTLQSRPKGMHREHPEDGYPIPIKPGAYYYPRPKFAT